MPSLPPVKTRLLSESDGVPDAEKSGPVCYLTDILAYISPRLSSALRSQNFMRQSSLREVKH
jgi:hypothetical protein